MQLNSIRKSYLKLETVLTWLCFCFGYKYQVPDNFSHGFRVTVELLIGRCLYILDKNKKIIIIQYSMLFCEAEKIIF